MTKERTEVVHFSPSLHDHTCKDIDQQQTPPCRGRRTTRVDLDAGDASFKNACIAIVSMPTAERQPEIITTQPYSKQPPKAHHSSKLITEKKYRRRRSLRPFLCQTRINDPHTT